MSQTTGTGAKKIQDSDNWRDIFDIHNDTVDAYDGKIGTTVLPTTAQTLTGAISEHNQAIAMNSLGTKSTIAALESALATLGGSMPNNSIRNVAFAIDTAQGVFKNANYVGTISRTASGRYTVLAQSHSSVQTGDLVTGVYANSAWAWQQLASKSDIATVSSSSTVAAGSSENVSYPTGFTRDNCVVISVYYTTTSTRQFQNVVASLGSGNITLINNDSTARSITCVLQKI